MMWAGPLAVDGLGQLVIFLCGAVALMALWSCPDSAAPLQSAALVLLFLVGVLFNVSTTNVLFFYISWEITAYFAWALGQVAAHRDEASRGALPLQGAGAISSLLMFLGLFLLALENNSLAMPGAQTGQVRLLSAIILAAIFFRAFALLSQVWHVDYQKRISLAGAVLGGAGVVALALYPFLRLFGDVFRGQTEWHPVAWWLAGGVGLVAAAAALGERDMYRVLTYSALAQFASVVLFFTAASRQGLAGAMVILLGYSLGVAGLYLCLGLVEASTGQRRFGAPVISHDEGPGAPEHSHLGGVSQPHLKATPFAAPLSQAALFLALSLVVVGLPPFGSSIGRAVVGLELLATGQTSLLILSSATAGLTLLALLRLFKAIFVRGNTGPAVGQRHWWVLFAVSAAVLALLAVTVWPAGVLHWFQPALAQLGG